MKLSPAELKDILENPSDEKINSLLHFNYEQIDFERILQCTEAFINIEKNQTNISKYLLCLLVLSSTTSYIKNYLEAKNIINKSSKYKSLISFLMRNNNQEWCIYKRIEVLLAYGKHWELFTKAPNAYNLDTKSGFRFYFYPTNFTNAELNNSPISALHLLTINKQYQLLKMAFDIELFNVNSFTDINENTVLHLDAKNGDNFIVSLCENSSLSMPLHNNIQNKNFLKIAIENENYKLIKNILQHGIIEYDKDLENFDVIYPKATIFHYLIENGRLDIIQEYMQSISIRYSDLYPSIWFSAISKGYFNLVADAAKNSMFNPLNTFETYEQEDKSSIWQVILNTNYQLFKDNRTSDPSKEKYDLLIQAIQQGLCDINLTCFNFYTKDHWNDLDILIQENIRNEMTLNLSKMIKNFNIGIKILISINWEEMIEEQKFASFKEGLSFYLLKCPAIHLKYILDNSTPSLAYAVLYNAINNISDLTDITKKCFINALQYLVKNQILDKLIIDQQFLEVFTFNIRENDILDILPDDYGKDSNAILLLNKLIHIAPKDNNAYMKALGNAITEFSLKNTKVTQDRTFMYHTWEAFAEKYKAFLWQNGNEYRNYLLDKGALLGSKFHDTYTVEPKHLNVNSYEEDDDINTNIKNENNGLYFNKSKFVNNNVSTSFIDRNNKRPKLE